MQHNFRNFNEILNRYKIINIPYYQRDYVWGTKNDGRNLFKFIDDIFTAYDTTTASSYFIGTLAFCSDRVNDVIDGQQRITSLILVLSALANKCSTEFFKKNESLLFPYGDDRFVLQENEYLTEEIKNALDYSNNFNTQGYKVDISKTLDKINSQINNAWGGRTENWYDGLYNYILNNVNFISLEYTNIGDSLKYFLNINSLSIQLTQSDIFYSILSQSLRITSNIHTIFEIKQRISKLSELRGLGESIEGYKCYDGNRNVDNVIYIFLKSYYQNDKNIQAFEETGIGKWLSFYKNEVFNDQLKAKNFK